MKRIALIFLLIFTIALTACGASSTSTPANPATDNELAQASQLAVGTLKLAGTTQDVTAEQAKELLILWQVYQDISQSSTSAQEEVDALVDQIQETMTYEQMQAISDMNLSQQDVFAAMQSADVNSSTLLSTNSVTAPTDGGGMPGGAPPDGGSMPADGGMPMDGGAAPASGTDSPQSAGSAPGLAGSAGVPSTLVVLVIQWLELKVAS